MTDVGCIWIFRPPSHFDMSCEATIEKSNKEMLHRYFVYITTNENKTTIYVGVTNNIQRRLSQHFFDSQNSKKSFAGKYNCFYLIYYEGFQDPMSAIAREKEIKKWRREKKEKLINTFNPKWEFINQEVI